MKRHASVSLIVNGSKLHKLLTAVSAIAQNRGEGRSFRYSADYERGSANDVSLGARTTIRSLVRDCLKPRGSFVRGRRDRGIRFNVGSLRLTVPPFVTSLDCHRR